MGAFKRAARVSNVRVGAVVGAAWMLGTFGGGWMLAWLYKRLHPSLAFYKLWAFWSMLLGAIVALMFGLGMVRI